MYYLSSVSFQKYSKICYKHPVESRGHKLHTWFLVSVPSISCKCWALGRSPQCLSLSLLVCEVEALIPNSQGCCVDWNFNRTYLTFSGAWINNWENRLLLRLEVVQADEGGGKEGEQREGWEKHFRDTTKNKTVCQQNWGLRPEASFPCPSPSLAVFLFCFSPFRLPESCYCMRIWREKKEKIIEVRPPLRFYVLEHISTML